MSTDGDIIRRSIEQPTAFAELFDRHARIVGAFAARRVGMDAAEDVVSETFLVAFRRRGDFDHSWESAKPWLLGIATRVAKKHRAQEARNWRSLQAAMRQPETSSSGGIDAAAAHLDAVVWAARLAPRIASLSTKDRDTLLLYAWGALTYEQIAAALGIPVGTVRSRLNRVRRKLGDEPHAGRNEPAKTEAGGR